MEYYCVTFEYQQFYCVNFVYAATKGNVEQHYRNKYKGYVSVREATPSELERAKRKHMPIISLP